MEPSEFIDMIAPFVFLMIGLRESQRRTRSSRTILIRTQTFLVNIVSLIYIIAAIEYLHFPKVTGYIWQKIGLGIFWGTWCFALVQVFITMRKGKKTPVIFRALGLGILAIIRALMTIPDIVSNGKGPMIAFFYFTASTLLMEMVANRSDSFKIISSEWLEPDFDPKKFN